VPSEEATNTTLTAQVAFGSIVTQPTIAPNVKLTQVSAQG
jgi:hypothetical protein